MLVHALMLVHAVAKIPRRIQEEGLQRWKL
jgi:hypothetical protein